MGGDGGSIPGRRDLVRERKRAEMSEKELELHIKWRMCQLTQERLKEPIVVDERGRLYSKEAVRFGLLLILILSFVGKINFLHFSIHFFIPLLDH